MASIKRDIGHEETDAILHKMERQVQGVYRQAAEDTQKKLDDYLARFKVKDQIKQERVKKGEITKKEYADWRKGQICIGKRWQEMLDTLSTDLTNADKIAMSIVNGYSPEVYAINHNYATFQIEQAGMLDTSYTLYDRQTVERLLREDQDLLPKAHVDVPKDKRWNRQHIQQQVTQGILQGEDLGKIAKRLQTVTDMDNSAAIRNARTITTGAENAGRVDSYKRAEKMGIQLEQEWLATLDGRTRHTHRMADGERVKVGEKFSNGCRYPGDPEGPPWEVYNCRCTLVPAVKGVDQSNAPRNSKLGGMTYEEWKKGKANPVHPAPPKAAPATASPTFTQVGIGLCKSVDEVSALLNSTGFFTTPCDLTGCDLDSAKAIASAYERVTTMYPKVRGQIGGVKAMDLRSNTYARNYIFHDRRTEVNSQKKYFGSWAQCVAKYENDVLIGFHPVGTTAESIIVHELGHAVDGLLSKAKMLGAKDPLDFSTPGKPHNTSFFLRQKVAQSTGVNIKDMRKEVSIYGSKDEMEWFAECFAEYLTSADPRPVAKCFGEMLEELMDKL